MSLLDKASLIVTPNSYKTSKLYSVVPNTTLGDMDVVRATTATRVNESGLIESVGVNIPRIDYTNGSCPSILVEPQRTNLFLQSNTFTNALWIKNSCTISANSIISPDGTQNASKLVEGTTNDSHHIYQNVISSGQNTFTFYAKQGERKFVYAYADGVGQGKCFDLENGILGVNIIAAPLNATITSVGNGWYRCSITISITATALRIGACSANGTFSYLGNGTSGIYIYSAQIEQGTYATSYIPTVASTVTRNADVISKTGISSLIGQTEGVIFLDCKIYPIDTKRLAINDGTIANVIFLQSDATNRIRFLITQNSISILDTGNFTLPNPNGFNKIAFKYKSNDFAIWVNGIKIYSSTAVALSFPVALSKFAFDFSASGLSFFGEVKSAQLYKTALTDTELQSLTTL